MQVHKFPFVIGIAGFLISGGALYRWMIMWHDTSQALFGFGIGVLIMAGGYLYNWMKNTDDKIRIETKRTDAIVDWFMNRQQDAVLDKARGIE